MNGDTPDQSRRQREILDHARSSIERILREAEKYSDAVEKGYFLGAVGGSTLMAGFTHADSAGSRSIADEWLSEQLRGLGCMLGEHTRRKMKLSIRFETGPAR